MREPGLPVELTSTASRRELPPGVDVSAYRIVQEALTNALKHAGPAQARVSVHFGADALELVIADNGAGATNGAGGAARPRRHAGTRRAFGGELASGPAAGRRLRGPGTAAAVIRVLIADDQRLVRSGFRMILGSDPELEVVGEAGDGVEAVAAPARCSRTSC